MKHRLYKVAQGELANADYYKSFTNIVKVIRIYGDKIGNDPTLFKVHE